MENRRIQRPKLKEGASLKLLAWIIAALFTGSLVGYFLGTLSYYGGLQSGNVCASVRSKAPSKSSAVQENYFCMANKKVYWLTLHKYGDHILLENYEVFGADPSTFTFLGGAYSKDAFHVYYNAGLLLDADPKTFKYLSYAYAKDVLHVYYGGAPVVGADDPKSFIVFGKYYAKDKNHVFWDNRVIPNADLATFTALSHFYAKDAHDVYYEEIVIYAADPVTFQTFGNSLYAKDKGKFYSRGKPFKVSDPKTFIVIEYGDIAKDSVHVYNGGPNGLTIVPNADPDKCSAQSFAACGLPGQ